MAVKKRDPLTGHMLTGHEWNGIWEINTAVPRPYWIFLIAAFVFSVGYWILMPAWPLGSTYTKGLLGIDQRDIVASHVEAARDARAKWTDRIASEDFATIAADPNLMAFIRQDGHRLFGDNCAACHGTNGKGTPGFPDLVDRDWLWGGSADTVFHTISVGINSHKSDDSRSSEMMAFGTGGVLERPQIVAVANYVKSLSDPAWAKGRANLVASGRAVFAENCVACHGEDGHGSHEMGAPDLADNTWLYGGDIDTIFTTIYGGRKGEMPAWGDRLTDVERKILTLYVLDRGGNLGNVNLPSEDAPAGDDGAAAESAT